MRPCGVRVLVGGSARRPGRRSAVGRRTINAAENGRPTPRHNRPGRTVTPRGIQATRLPIGRPGANPLRARVEFSHSGPYVFYMSF